jgi:SAM-dependent methyltransferase
MKSPRETRMDSFLAHYAAIHEVDNAYGFARESTNAYRQAAEQLYAQSESYLATLPLDDVRSIIDVGCGYGMHCAWFAAQGLDVTGVSTDISEELRTHARAHGYQLAQMDMHFLDMDENCLDMVWSHHCLEHSFGPLLALWEWQRVLKPGGILAVTVPPHKTMIVSGHFTAGWSIGQLLYVLAVTGFDVANGSFVREGYNVRALVRKPDQPIDPQGLSWLQNLRDKLPESLRAHLIEHERSPGSFQFDGDLRVLSPTTLEPTHK